MTAYFLWMNEEGRWDSATIGINNVCVGLIFLNIKFFREEIKKKHPDWGITEVSKAAGEKWRSLDEDIKNKYEEKHKDLKEKYDEEYKEWFESGGKEAIKAAKKGGGGGGKSSPKKKVVKEVSGGTGGSYQSKEFIEDSDSGGSD